GKSTALEILFEGRVFGSDEAMTKGLLTKVVGPEKLDEEVKKVVENICAGAPLVNRWHKKFANRILEGLNQGKTLTEQELREGFDCFDTDDFKEGYKAFIEKREPSFSGN
ncbi:MAG: enoyl-CoA hydratase-related protein, partial [Pseudomonadota bacterium]|nr:enoyl-CoA hydratase-related protein [Pseudomonadota bacterium]